MEIKKRTKTEYQRHLDDLPIPMEWRDKVPKKPTYKLYGHDQCLFGTWLRQNRREKFDIMYLNWLNERIDIPKPKEKHFHYAKEIKFE